MSVELPPGLRAAIDRELSGASRRDLAERTAATSAAYRAGRGSSAVIKGRDDALAYALARLPATFAAGVSVFAEARRLAPDFAPASLLDAGCGPGGGSWAAAEVWPSLERIVWFDASAPFLDMAGRLAEDAPDPVRQADAQRGDLATGPFPKADLVLASYALAEIAAAAQATVVGRLWEACEGVLALVEPGTPAGYARILAARDLLIAAGARIFAPCPHANACPLTAPDWCHFSVRLPRSRDHRLAKGAVMSFEDEKFAYLLAARPAVAAEPAAGRILARPKAGKPGIEFKVCGAEALERRFVPRRDKLGHATARRLDWGEAWP
ncbi:MAG: methyltransferase domain-containing protein [Phenylobacterium sp.]|uniref:small ribosomal subunit Rsm22 family protein n=1 Tax=Phenylobacterium sp. TaxID=1871053 RepID=UPI0012207A9D|nr:small ribosomal subunit Rsm22 family protein [Phenylobacterium sp.]TAJ71373.1 MAG: methyltransferase domain-containing protein [Phenylobacterium sp.]